MPGGHDDRLTKVVASAAQAPSRMPPSVSIATAFGEVEGVHGVLDPPVDGVTEGEPHPRITAGVGETVARCPRPPCRCR